MDHSVHHTSQGYQKALVHPTSDLSPSTYQHICRILQHTVPSQRKRRGVTYCFRAIRSLWLSSHHTMPLLRVLMLATQTRLKR